MKSPPLAACASERRIERGVFIRSIMRRAFALTLLLLLLASLIAPAASATPGGYGEAGTVISIDGRALGMWTLTDGSSLIIDSEGEMSRWTVEGDEAGTETWSHDLNREILDASLRTDDNRDLLAISNSSGVVIFSIEHQTTTYVIPLSESVSAVTWDAAGDIWLTLAASRIAAQYHDGTATGLQTSAHSIGISSVEALSNGEVVTGGRDRQLRVHDSLGQFQFTLDDPEAEVMELWEDGHARLHALTKGGQHIVYETANWTKIHDSNYQSSSRLSSIIDIGDGRLILGSANGRARMLNSTSLSVMETFVASGDIVGARGIGSTGVMTLSAFISSSSAILWDTDDDGDGVVNSHDAFPDDDTQSADTDGDGHGDSLTGTDGDAFPNDPTQWLDRDGDGYGDNPAGDNPDDFPDNEEQHSDRDFDGYGDAMFGKDGDRFPDDPNQWGDGDGDGYGDEPGHDSSDDCPTRGGYSQHDRQGCPDYDGDGWSDPDDDWPVGPIDGADAFWKEPTQWRDGDGDGYGDNRSGFQPDTCLQTKPGVRVSTRGIMYNTSTERADTIPWYGCDDLDGDSYSDESEAWWEPSNCPGILVGNGSEWLDYDRDCIGSNSDYDDTDSSVKTLEDWCEENINDTACRSFRSSVVNDPAPPVEEASRGDRVMSSLKEFAFIGGAVGVGMIAVLFLIQGLAGLVRASRAKEDDANYSSRDATKEIESGKSRSIGGIIDEGGWDDEVAPLQHIAGLDELAAALDDEESEASNAEAPDEDATPASESSTNVSEVDGEGEWESGQQGWEHYQQESPPIDESESTTSSEEAESTPAAADKSETPEATASSPPAEAPPIPAEGLPSGWTEDQWRWYGHEWLQKQGRA